MVKKICKKSTKKAFSGYRFLWIQVIFDLPVSAKQMRKDAANFRNQLLDLGFYMCQFSVYFKWCSGKESALVVINKIKNFIPRHGKVHILVITDKQYSNIINFNRSCLAKNMKNPNQYDLF